MMRSLFSAVSGLRVHQTKMDVIANNISNVNTAGYKSSRVTFYDVFNQTISKASQASEATGRGGKNPMQIGLGANVASIDMMMTPGAAQRTDWSLDLMIEGDGFFIVSDGPQNTPYYTRAGAFRVDEAGNLTNPAGLRVNGWARERDTDVTSPTYGEWVVRPSENVSPIVITDEMERTDGEPTTMIGMNGNLNAMIDGAEGVKSSVSFYDTIGNEYTMDVVYKYHPKTAGVPAAPPAPAVPANDTAYWSMEIQYDPIDGTNAKLAEDSSQRFTLDFEFGQYTDAAYAAKDTTIAPYDPGTAVLPTQSLNVTFNEFGELTGIYQGGFTGTDISTGGTSLIPAGGNPSQIVMSVGPAAGSPLMPTADFGRELTGGATRETNSQVIMDFANLVQKSLPSDFTGSPIDGMAAGVIEETSVDESGKMYGVYSNGKTEILAQVAIATVKNPAGMEKYGNSLFRTTNNSGEANVGAAGSGGSSLLSGSLEMSNVDLSQEFTEMITTQRGFQANSRVITTSDDMLQELVNLKR